MRKKRKVVLQMLQVELELATGAQESSGVGVQKVWRDFGFQLSKAEQDMTDVDDRREVASGSSGSVVAGKGLKEMVLRSWRIRGRSCDALDESPDHFLPLVCCFIRRIDPLIPLLDSSYYLRPPIQFRRTRQFVLLQFQSLVLVLN